MNNFFLMIIMIMMMINLMFMNCKNLLMMGFILILQTMLITMYLGKINLTFWMSFIIFLVFIGGMMILFMYVISLINNSFFKMKNFKFLLIFLLIYLMNFEIYNNYEMMIFNKNMHLNMENSLFLIKLFNMPNMIINKMIIMYLFLMMVITSKIINYKMGPFFYKY